MVLVRIIAKHFTNRKVPDKPHSSIFFHFSLDTHIQPLDQSSVLQKLLYLNSPSNSNSNPNILTLVVFLLLLATMKIGNLDFMCTGYFFLCVKFYFSFASYYNLPIQIFLQVYNNITLILSNNTAEFK